MSVLNDLIKRLLNSSNTNSKQKWFDTISGYPDTPKLKGSLSKLLPTIGSRSDLIVPANGSSVEDESLSTFKDRFDKITSLKKRELAYDDYCIFLSERQKMLANGFLYVNAERKRFDLVKLTKCIKDRGVGDDNGFHVEPDTFVSGYVSIDGEFLSPIALDESQTNVNIRNWLAMNRDPFDSTGNIMIYPYEKARQLYKALGYFEVQIGESVGVIDKELNLILPIFYKMLFCQENGLIWVRLHNNLCGIVDLQNNTKIPPVYNYLSYIEKGKYRGLYIAELNGKHGLIDDENQIVIPFMRIDIKSFNKLVN